jgi:phosphotransferase system enzyme I (PtsI)
VRLCLKRPDIFTPQIRGVLRAAARFDNIRVMLPLVVNTEEVLQVRRLFAAEAERLKAEGQAARADLPVGIMVEVPAAANAADILARVSDFFSIGTNDLIQYSLAVDRENDSVAYLYQPLHPGLLRMLRFIVRSGIEQGIPVSMCGEMAGDPSVARLLIGLGLRELSMQSRAIPAVREVVRQIDVSEAQRFADDALARLTATEIERHLRESTV